MQKLEYSHWLVLKDCGRYKEFKKGQIIKGWHIHRLDSMLGGKKYDPPTIKGLVDSGCIQRVFRTDIPHIRAKQKREGYSIQKRNCNFKKDVIY